MSITDFWKRLPVRPPVRRNTLVEFAFDEHLESRSSAPRPTRMFGSLPDDERRRLQAMASAADRIIDAGTKGPDMTQTPGDQWESILRAVNVSTGERAMTESLGRLTVFPVSSAAARSPQTSKREGGLSSTVCRTHWRHTMSLASTAAIIVVVLAVTFGVFANVRDRSSDQPLRLASLIDATPEGTPFANQGSMEPATLVPTGNLPLPVEVTRLLPEECTVQPRSRDELLAVLSEPSSEVAGDPVGRLQEDLNLPASIDNETYELLQQIYQEWQACAYYGLTMERLALESNESIRRSVYENGQVTGYSSSTLNEIIDGWLEVDAYRLDVGAIGTDQNSGTQILVLDPTELRVSQDGAYVSISVSQGFPGIGVVDHQVAHVEFVLEDGYWRILWHGDPGRG